MNFECGIGAHDITWRVVQKGARDYRIIGVCSQCNKEVAPPENGSAATFNTAFGIATRLNEKGKNKNDTTRK